MKTKNKSNKVLFALVFLVVGFLLAFSYRTLGSSQKVEQYISATFIQEEKYREELVEQKERNKELADEIAEKKDQLRTYEKTFSTDEEQYEELVAEAHDLRLLLGNVPAKGSGLKVTLQDAEYDPSLQNPNDYIVHESHVFEVMNELKIAGAEGIAINGKRINENSYIKCTGPVITIDGQTFPEPFVIEAVGDTDVLNKALRLKGGVMDALMRDHIVVTIEQLKEIQLAAVGE